MYWKTQLLFKICHWSDLNQQSEFNNTTPLPGDGKYYIKKKKKLNLSFKLQASGLEQTWIIHSLIPHIHLTHLCRRFRAPSHESGVTISRGNQSLADPSSDSNLLADSASSWSWGWQMGLSGLGVKGRKQESISTLIKRSGCLTSPCNSFDSGNRQI